MRKLLFLLLTAALALPMTAQLTAPRKALFPANRNEVVTSTPLQINDWGTVKMNREMKPTFSCDFDTQEQIDAWTNIDNDGDGYAWETVEFNNGGFGMASRSYYNYQSLDPDNWLISPVVTLNGELSFLAINANSMWPDKLAVYACVGDGTSPEDFVMISDGDITPESSWSTYTIDLSAYAGQQGRIAFVHHNSYDNYYLVIDDVEISSPVPVPVNVEAVPGSTDASIYWADDNNVAWNLRYRLYNPDNKYWDFEEEMAEDNSLPGGWTTIDADGDGNKWYHLNTTGTWNCHGTPGHVTSASWATSALTPDNWLVSPQAKLFGQLSLWINGQDPEYPAEVFAVYVSTGDPTDPASFVLVSDEEMIANAEPTEYVFDLSEYDGQMGYVAVRHYGVTDMFRLNVDDVAIGNLWTYVNDLDATDYTIEGLTPENDYEVQVQGVDEDGLVSDWTEILKFTTEAVPVIPDVYLLGLVNDQNWAANVGTPMTYDAENMIYTATVNLDAYETFGFTTELAEYNDEGSWAYIEPFRFGPESNGDFELLDQYLNQPLTLTFDVYGAIKVMSTAEYKITVSLEENYIIVEKITPEPPAYLRGDVDNDGDVDIDDVTRLIDVVLGKDVTYNAAAADCNTETGDGSVDIDDVTALINRVLKGSWD